MLSLNDVVVGNLFFPNKELNLLEINKAIVNGVSKNLNVITMKYHDDRDLMALYFIKKHLDKVEPNSKVELVISYMPYSRMDRAETAKTPFMLEYVTEFINDLQFDEVSVYEPHSNVTVELLNNVTDLYPNKYLFEEVKQVEKFNDTIDFLVFPDKGARQRYNGLIDSDNVIVGEKKRDFTSGKITSLELNLAKGSMEINNDLTAVIVDDLSSYGGTFIGVSKELKKLGFNRVVLLVFHAENSIFKGELFDHVDHVYTTDSILTDHKLFYTIDKQNKLTVFQF